MYKRQQRALLRGGEAGEQAQQRGLPGSVGPDEADDVPGGDDEVEPGEERAVAVSGGEVLGDESGTHETTDSNRWPATARTGFFRPRAAGACACSRARAVDSVSANPTPRSPAAAGFRRVCHFGPAGGELACTVGAWQAM